MSRLHPIFNVIILTLAPEDPIHRQCPLHPPLPVMNSPNLWLHNQLIFEIYKSFNSPHYPSDHLEHFLFGTKPHVTKKLTTTQGK